MNNPNTDLEKSLWSSADKLRSNIDATEYKHVVVGLIFLKYVSDSFEEIHKELENEREHLSYPEDRYECLSRNIVWVPMRQVGISC
ncbi:MAG: type I restriction-modification system subunit M N-terminal domain-containing protein [Candidatus Thermoplasmatota archaeon]|nr:type I restriction-modification system subunit M N-terminal domain-containing protein [Candidatus Thermoplasmatota archaeon]